MTKRQRKASSPFVNDEISSGSEFRKIIFSMPVMVFILTLGSFLNDVLLYTHNGAFFHTFAYSLILGIYAIGWMVALWCGRSVVWFCLLTNFILFCIFKEYYKVNVNALNIYGIMSAFKEGAWAGITNIKSLLDVSFWIMGFVTAAEMVWISLLSFRNLKKAFLSLTGGALVIGLLIVTGNLRWGEYLLYLFPNLHASYEQGMLYKISFTIDSLRENPLKQLDKIIHAGNQLQQESYRTDDIQLSRLPAHIYLIQVESLTTLPLTEKIMPFLTARLQQSNVWYWTDEKHYHCLGSANTDFMMMTGIDMKCTQNRQIIYFKYPTDIYKKIKTLPQRFKSKGYQTFFLHGFEGQFFNRFVHYPAMGFDKIVFMENFPHRLKRGLWGISDKNVLKGGLILNKNYPKTFTFIITAAMHPPYQSVGRDKPFPSPVSEKEKYLNAAAQLDTALSMFNDRLPEDSLVILYGDHNAPDVGALDTPLIMWYKGNQPITVVGKKELGFIKTIEYINSIFD